MPTADAITAIRPLSDDSNRFAVRVGRKAVATLHQEQIESLGLVVGMPFTGSLAQQLQTAAAAEAARIDAVRLLNRRPLSAGELDFRLRRKGHPPELVAAAVGRMVDKGLIDELRYARSLIELTLNRKAAGPALLKRKLFQHRINPAIIQQALAGVPASTAADARALAEKKLRSPSLRKLEPDKRYRRLSGMLARRGFDPGVIRQALAGLNQFDAEGDWDF